MMTKCLVKLMIIVLVTIMSIQLLSINCFVNADAIDPMNEVLTVTNQSTDSNLPGVLTNIGGAILTVFKVVGVGVAMIMLIVLAMKYMLASAGDKADIKKHAVVYIVGAIILFAASGILQIIQSFSNNLNE